LIKGGIPGLPLDNTQIPPILNNRIQPETLSRNQTVVAAILASSDTSYSGISAPIKSVNTF